MREDIDTSLALSELEKSYRKARKPLPINFRSAVPWIPYNSPRYTHLLHTYPAKVIPQIPHFFLSARSITDKGATVLDPFSGSGTVALETCISGCNAIASDANPLARLLTKAKTTPISPQRLANSLEKIRRAIRASRARNPPPVMNLDYWYTPNAIKQLTRIGAVVADIQAPDLKALAQVAFSACARKASLTDPRISVPVRINPSRYDKKSPLYIQSKSHLLKTKNLDVFDLFDSILNNFSEQVSSLWPLRNTIGNVSTIYDNSLSQSGSSLINHEQNSVDLIITSPPYLGAQKYVRATSLSLTWLGLAKDTEIRGLEKLSIGREHYAQSEFEFPLKCGVSEPDKLISLVHKSNPLRAHIAAMYLTEMREVLTLCYSLLRPGGKLVLVSGCNSLCGRPFDTTSYLIDCCRRLGFNVRLELSDVIKSRGLMTRRNHTAGLIPTESVVLFNK